MIHHLAFRLLLLTLACAAPMAVASEEAPAGKDAPVFAITGYVKPVERERGCVGRTVRIPADLIGAADQVVVRFAVEPDGTPSRFEVLTEEKDQRIGEAIWTAIQSCQFNPGRDPAGRPVAIWLILPIRFIAGQVRPPDPARR